MRFIREPVGEFEIEERRRSFVVHGPDANGGVSPDYPYEHLESLVAALIRFADWKTRVVEVLEAELS